MNTAGGPSAKAPKWQGQFFMLAGIWGLSFLFIKIGLETLAPLQVALGRMVFGAGALLVVLIVRRDQLPRDRRLWAHLAVVALLLNAAPFTLFAYGEQRVSSVLAGIWNATTPLLTLLVVLVALPEERPTHERAVGLVVGFVGVLVVLGVWSGLAGEELTANLLCLAAAACYGLGFPYNRRFLRGRGESMVSLSAAQLLCGTVELAIITPFGTSWPSHVPGHVLASVIVLGAVGTGFAYILNNSIIRTAGATIASTVTYAIPLFSTAAGMLFLGERLTWNQPVGAFIVIVGVAVSQGRMRTLLARASRRPPGRRTAAT